MTEDSDYLWNPRSQSQEPELVALEKALQAYRFDSATPAPILQRKPSVWMRVRPSVVAAALLLIGVTTLLVRPAKWSVRAQGVVTIDNAPITSSSRLRPGHELVTADGASARVKVGSIGEIELTEGSAVRLDAADATGHRFTLQRGEVHARIWAKPRFFEVATTQVRAIDLGCVYTLRVDEQGATSLEVLYGTVELAGALNATTLVPAGNAAGVDALGRGVPWPLSSTPAFQLAATILSSGAPDSMALATLSGGADARASITLWHLLPRVDASFRMPLARRLAEIVPLPPGVTLDRVVDLDSAAMNAWEATLRQRWTPEPESAWRRFLTKWRVVKPRAVFTLPEGGGRS